MKASVSSEQITTASNPSFTAHEQNVATIVYQPLLCYTVDMVLVRILLKLSSPVVAHVDNLPGTAGFNSSGA